MLAKVANCQNLTTRPTRSAVFCYNISYNFHQHCNFSVQYTNPYSTMPASDSEDFESADEGISHLENKGRKKRSSSNYSDKSVKNETTPQKSNPKPEENPSEGWDDFDVDVEDTNAVQTTGGTKEEKNVASTKKSKNISESNCKDTGWDEFDDWGQVDVVEQPKTTVTSGGQEENKSIKDVTDRLAESSNKGWGWGWGVDSLLSTATAGITTLTSQVSQGISTVLETSIGAPDPEELARLSVKVGEKTKENQEKERQQIGDNACEKSATDEDRGSEAFQFGSLLSGVTKFVETTGSKVISGGLDTLETIGKKTMEVLQDGDPGLAKKRAMLGLDPSEKPVLSQVLREAKARADEEDKVKEAKREAKEVHYENLFDDFEGLVHLEALEMLSRQVSMRIEERIRTAEPDKRQDIKETLQQVAELCEMPEEDEDDVDSCDTSELSKSEALHERLQTATQDLGLKLTFQPIVKQYEDITSWLSNTEDNVTERSVYAKAVSGLAQSTASAVELYHKTAEMLLVKTRRSTADESDAMTQMTVVLTKHISELATLFTEKLNSITTVNKEQVNTYITNIFLEAGNSSTYIQNAFQLTLPILQIGAV